MAATKAFAVNAKTQVARTCFQHMGNVACTLSRSGVGDTS